jgi:hypothetical protein
MYSVVSTGMVAGDIRILIHCEGLIVGCPSPLWRKGVGERESQQKTGYRSIAGVTVMNAIRHCKSTRVWSCELGWAFYAEPSLA